MDILALLKVERDKVARQLKGLNAAVAAFAGEYTDGAGRPRRSKLSAKGLANIRAAQKARWNKARRQKGPTVSTPRRRTMSAAARRKIAAAQRARWAKVKRA
jgi:hypothetical protein